MSKAIEEKPELGFRGRYGGAGLNMVVCARKRTWAMKLLGFRPKTPRGLQELQEGSKIGFNIHVTETTMSKGNRIPRETLLPWNLAPNLRCRKRLSNTIRRRGNFPSSSTFPLSPRFKWNTNSTAQDIYYLKARSTVRNQKADRRRRTYPIPEPCASRIVACCWSMTKIVRWRWNSTLLCRWLVMMKGRSCLAVRDDELLQLWVTSSNFWLLLFSFYELSVAFCFLIPLLLLFWFYRVQIVVCSVEEWDWRVITWIEGWVCYP